MSTDVTRSPSRRARRRAARRRPAGRSPRRPRRGQRGQPLRDPRLQRLRLRRHLRAQVHAGLAHAVRHDRGRLVERPERADLRRDGRRDGADVDVRPRRDDPGPGQHRRLVLPVPPGSGGDGQGPARRSPSRRAVRRRCRTPRAPPATRAASSTGSRRARRPSRSSRTSRCTLASSGAAAATAGAAAPRALAALRTRRAGPLPRPRASRPWRSDHDAARSRRRHRFALLALLHVHWAAGGRTGWRAALPEVGGRPAFVPGRGVTLLVAAAARRLCGAGPRDRRPARDAASRRLARLGIGALAVVLALRAIGDFRLVGLTKTVRGTRFARLDDLLYAPLCLALAAGVGTIALLPRLSAPCRRTRPRSAVASRPWYAAPGSTSPPTRHAQRTSHRRRPLRRSDPRARRATSAPSRRRRRVPAAWS